MSKGVIVITVGRQNLSTPRRQVQDVWTGCDINYVNSVLRSGGAPPWLRLKVLSADGAQVKRPIGADTS